MLFGISECPQRKRHWPLPSVREEKSAKAVSPMREQTHAVCSLLTGGSGIGRFRVSYSITARISLWRTIVYVSSSLSFTSVPEYLE